eukprot:1472230-Prymnesium_polylepis.1
MVKGNQARRAAGRVERSVVLDRGTRPTSRAYFGSPTSLISGASTPLGISPAAGASRSPRCTGPAAPSSA